MIKIKVQNKFSMLTAAILCAVVILIVIAIGFFVFNTDYTNTKLRFYDLWYLVLFFIPLWLRNTNSKETYVSDIIINNDEMTILYKLGKEETPITFPMKNIKSFKAVLNANNVAISRSVTLMCETTVNIELENGENINFKENPTASFSFCNYEFMLRLLKYSTLIPNFSYDIIGNSKETATDVKNFAQYGKRLSFFARQKVYFDNLDGFTKILLFVVFSMLGVSIYFIAPPLPMNDNEVEFMEHFDNADYLRENSSPEKALEELSKAETLYAKDPYLYQQKAYCYEDLKQYDKAIIEAKKGIEFKDEKSIYKKSHGYKWGISPDIALYTILGYSSQQAGDFKQCKDAYTYVTKNVSYKYTDAYFYKGYCEYQLGEKSTAIEDFEKYREIILNYFADQEVTEYKDQYPRYKNEDLETAEEWLNYAKTN